MDKAIIFGVYDFVNFHMCKTLLNKGLVVHGIHIEEIEKVQFLDEKRFEIGRNANFVEQMLSDWENGREQELEKTVLIFSLFDLYMQSKENILQKEDVSRAIFNYLRQDRENIELVLLLPVQLLQLNRESGLESFLKQVTELQKKIQLVFLPSIFGPWQSSVFMFQQAIISRFQSIDVMKQDREWTNDTIFIGDAVETIAEIIEKEVHGSYLLESGQKDYWKKCASYLGIEESIVEGEPIQTDDQIVKVSVKNHTPISESITNQLKQAERLFRNKS